ncbi:ABC transporter ATP-binding protein [Gordonia desulfuricans]|uniref:ABC transporter ATP-binding protein n=1 Tax=Gordonia desulfuricans TaxID=89051 RepID=A0A7K3LLG6_9ACTN|nr:ATP-binding cassette domain-containing protein [Gordonia desulfuricans]NDK88891.1 ABC transporter ATP-binding protein [Gordonia desulfuricans]
MTEPIARVTGLTVDIATRRDRRADTVRVLDDVDLCLAAGSVTALIGESGCGKSMLAAALTGLLPPGSRVGGTVTVAGETLGVDDPRWRALRGRHIGLVPQSPMTSFTPVRTLGGQLSEVVDVLGGSRTPAELCADVGLPVDALDCYPHELSGGMAQRAAVAAAIVAEPAVIVADEPTSALDPKRAQAIWALLGSLAERGAAVLVITHDMDALTEARVCRSIAVMRAGRIVAEQDLQACAEHPDDYVAAFFTPIR